MSYFANAGQILIQFIFGAFVTLIILRILLQMVHANFYNPVCQFIYKSTNPVLAPLRRVIPPWRNLDVACLLVAYALELLQVFLLSALFGAGLPFASLLVYGFAELMDFVLVLYFWIILARIIISFANSEARHPIIPLLYQLTEPILRRIRRLLPDLGGFDFSPTVAALIIYLARILLVQPLLDLARHIA